MVGVDPILGFPPTIMPLQSSFRREIKQIGSCRLTKNQTAAALLPRHPKSKIFRSTRADSPPPRVRGFSLAIAERTGRGHGHGAAREEEKKEEGNAPRLPPHSLALGWQPRESRAPRAGPLSPPSRSVPRRGGPTPRTRFVCNANTPPPPAPRQVGRRAA